MNVGRPNQSIEKQFIFAFFSGGRLEFSRKLAFLFFGGAVLELDNSKVLEHWREKRMSFGLKKRISLACWSNFWTLEFFLYYSFKRKVPLVFSHRFKLSGSSWVDKGSFGRWVENLQIWVIHFHVSWKFKDRPPKPPFQKTIAGLMKGSSTIISTFPKKALLRPYFPGVFFGGRVGTERLPGCP